MRSVLSLYILVCVCVCFGCVRGKNTLCKHLNTERYCLALVDRCRWCVYLSMKLIPINNKLNRCLSNITMKTNHTHTHTQREREREANSRDDCKRLWHKGVSFGVLTFVCVSTIRIIDNILRTKCLFLDHNLMSKDNQCKLYERFTVTDVLKSDWKSRLRHWFCTIKEKPPPTMCT